MADSSNKAKLAALVGAPAAAIALLLTQHWEGTRNTGYRDVVGIATYCTGVTGKGAVVGKHYTPADCEEADSKAIVAHARPVLICAPSLREHSHALGAAISLTYNIGPTAFCHSTVARKFNAGDVRGGCDAFLPWNKAGGRVIAGLSNRRASERAECLKDAD